MSLATRSFRAFAASLFISTLAVTDVLRAAENAPRDLSGSWTLDTERSQVPSRDGMDDGTRPTGRFGGGLSGAGMGGGRPGGGPMGGGMGGGMDPERMRRARETMRELMDAPAHLSISNDEGAVVLEAPDGSRERLVADGRKHAHALASGDVTNRAQWRDGVLRVETTTKDGVKIERRFALEPEGDAVHLVITYIANLPMARRPLEVKKVYGRAAD